MITDILLIKARFIALYIQITGITTADLDCLAMLRDTFFQQSRITKPSQLILDLPIILILHSQAILFSHLISTIITRAYCSTVTRTTAENIVNKVAVWPCECWCAAKSKRYLFFRHFRIILRLVLEETSNGWHFVYICFFFHTGKEKGENEYWWEFWCWKLR